MPVDSASFVCLGIVSMNQVSQELNYLVHTAIANTSEAEKPKNTAVGKK